jgi:hypothetical protein
LDAQESLCISTEAITKVRNIQYSNMRNR